MQARIPKPRFALGLEFWLLAFKLTPNVEDKMPLKVMSDCHLSAVKERSGLVGEREKRLISPLSLYQACLELPLLPLLQASRGNASKVSLAGFSKFVFNSKSCSLLTGPSPKFLQREKEMNGTRCRESGRRKR